MSLTDYVIMPGTDYQAICDAIRSKLETTETYTSEQLSTLISEIGDIIYGYNRVENEDGSVTYVEYTSYPENYTGSYTVTENGILETKDKIMTSNLVVNVPTSTPNVVAGDTPVRMCTDVGSIYSSEMSDMGISIVATTAGTYRVKCFVSHNYTADDQAFSIQFYKNGVAIGELFDVPAGDGVWISTDVTCGAYDTIKVYGVSSANSEDYTLTATGLTLCIDWDTVFMIETVSQQHTVAIDAAVSGATLTVTYNGNTYSDGDVFAINDGDSIIVNITTDITNEHSYLYNGIEQKTVSGVTTSTYSYTPNNQVIIGFTYSVANGAVCSLTEVSTTPIY